MIRLPQLDGLRAVAVTCVMAFHFIPGIDRFAPLGSIGVRLFFVLSGFLITRILLTYRSSTHDQAASGAVVRSGLQSFYVRRSLRIFPLFYLVLAITWAMNIGPVRSTIGWHLPYLTNVYLFDRGSWHGSISHLWSLAVEEQFYLAWPFVVLLTPAAMLRPLIVAMVCMAPISRLLIGGAMNSVLPTSCLDSLGAGAFIAVTGKPLFHAAAGPTMFVGGLMLGSEAGVDFGVSLAAGHVIAGASRGFDGIAGAVLKARPLNYVGTISYGLYVFHGFMPYVLGRYVPGFIAMPILTRAALLTAASFAAASLSWKFFEAPILLLKDRFAPANNVRLARAA